MANETKPTSKAEIVTASSSTFSGARIIQNLADKETVHESPINLDINKMTAIQLPPLVWYNMDLQPKKMKITNTGYTLIVSAKWQQERPYICQGPLLSNYVFSQLHFHWGQTDAEGSEHTADAVKYPLEMHAVFFKANYLTQESALKEKDGIVVVVYLYKLQSGKNLAFQNLIDNINSIQKPHTSQKFEPVPLSKFMKKFEKDYFVYWGSVTTTVCLHYILWIITREPIGISSEQVEELRTILDTNEQPLQGNFRDVQPLHDRQVFHVNPSGNKNATLLPIR